jgi:hypothetical protein
MKTFANNMDSTDPAQAGITEAFHNLILAEHVLRKNKWSWMAFHPPKDTPEGIEYYHQQEASIQAEMKLWNVTDIEYDRNGFREYVWTWRYWKVEARKCCWYQKTLCSTWRAGWTMKMLQQAEDNLVHVCGLQSIYRSSCSYIEEQFPNLKP